MVLDDVLASVQDRGSESFQDRCVADGRLPFVKGRGQSLYIGQ